jgi:hypothetical protein
MANEIGFNPFTHGVQGPSTNPFVDHGAEAPAPAHGNQTHQAPEGLSGREPQMGGSMPPRGAMKLGTLPPVAGSHIPAPPVDSETLHAISMQRQQTVNNTALAVATAEAQKAQGLNEFLKSMAEMQAKSIKSGGEKLAGLA